MSDGRRRITQFPKNSYETVVFSTSDFKGKQYLDMRLWGKSDDGKDEFATKKGLTLAVALYPEFKKAMASVEAELINRGLIDREDLSHAI